MKIKIKKMNNKSKTFQSHLYLTLGFRKVIKKRKQRQRKTVIRKKKSKKPQI